MSSNVMRFVGAGAAVGLLVPAFASAASFQANETIDLRAGERITEDVYVAGGTVTSGSSITGDLYAAGGTVLVAGDISADAVIGGGNVTITGAVGDDLRVGGGTVLVQGTVSGDVVIGGGQVHVSSSRIGGDVAIGGGVVRLDAPVGRSVRIGGGEVYINNSVVGNVSVQAEKLTLGPNAVIRGNLSYTSPEEVMMEEGAQVLGEVTYTPAKVADGRAFAAAFFSAALFLKLAMLFAGAFLFGMVFKRWSSTLVSRALSRPFSTLGLGLLILIVAPVVSVLLLITLVGLPFGIMGLLGYVVALIASWLIAPILLGSLLAHWRRRENGYHVSLKTIVLGVLAYLILGFIPFLGWLVQFGLVLLALGALASLKWHIAKEWR